MCKSVALLLSCLVIPVITRISFKSDLCSNQEAVSRALQEYFKTEKTLGAVLLHYCYQDLSPMFHTPVVLFTGEEDIQNCERQPELEGYVFLINNDKGFAERTVEALKCFNKTTMSMRTKRVLLIDFTTKGKESTQTTVYLPYLRSLWEEFGLIHITILPLTSDEENLMTMELFSYNPFKSSSIESKGLLFKCDFSHSVTDCLEERFCNMNGHPLNAVFFPTQHVNLQYLTDPTTLGLSRDVRFKWTVESYFNVSLIPREVTYTNPYDCSTKKGKPIGLLKEITQHKAELTLNSLGLGLCISPEIQFMTPVMDDSMDFIVPKPRRINAFEVFLCIFHWQVCVGTLLALVLLCIAAVLLEYVLSKRDAGLNVSPVSAVVNVCQPILTCGVNHLPKHSSQRLLMATTMVFGLVMMTLFAGRMFFLIKTTPRFPNVKTIEELQDSELDIVSAHKMLVPWLKDFQFRTSIKQLGKRIRYDKIYDKIGFGDIYVLRNISDIDHALILSDLLFQLEVLRSKHDVLDHVDVLKEKLIRLPVGYTMPTGSIYYDIFNKLNLKLFETGLSEKWHVKHFIHMNKELNKQVPERDEGLRQENGPRLLSMSDLKAPFFFLLFGHIMTVLVFLVELVVHKFGLF